MGHRAWKEDPGSQRGDERARGTTAESRTDGSER
jgi:hypothetical protein